MDACFPESFLAASAECELLMCMCAPLFFTAGVCMSTEKQKKVFELSEFMTIT